MTPPGEEGSDGEAVSEASSAISGGEFDTLDTAVVGVALVDAKGNVRRACSGALLAPNLVLTAQHCIASTSKYVNCATSAFSGQSAPSEVQVTTSPSMWSPMAEWRRARSISVPSGGPAVCGRDMALLTLWESVPREEARSLVPRLSRVVDDGEKYAAVGFGTTGADGDAGLRRRRDELRVTCVGAFCAGNVDGREWRGSQGVCSGDSGGPALDEAGRVIGVTSRGPAGCEDPVYGGLIAWRGWVRDVAAEAASLGAYEPADWVGDWDEDGHPGDTDFDERWASCSAAATVASGSGEGWRARAAAGALAALALARSVRRRRPRRAGCAVRD